MLASLKADSAPGTTQETEPPVTPERSRLMAGIRGKDTKPERIVRRLAHSLGYRFRLHRRDLPGCPDLVFPSRQKAIFVHGCFWHQHSNCRKATLPKTRRAFWRAKLFKNRARDRRAIKALESEGWSALIVWECEMKDLALLSRRLQSFLSGGAR
jgi:DNA mismatch endonuclease, patch repair protein